MKPTRRAFAHVLGSRLSRRAVTGLCAVQVLCLGALSQAATVEVVNLDAAGVGFNDTTPAALAPGNSGQTVGEQKLAVVQWVAARMGELLYSSVPIVVEVEHSAELFCDAQAATLASAGPAWLLRRQSQVADHPAAPTWYPSALGQRLLGQTLFDQDVSAQFNVDLGEQDCLPGFTWYYGLDNAVPGGSLSFAATVMHEFTHGLGFTSLVGQDGTVSALDPTAISPFFAYAFDVGTQQYWWQLSAEERTASATSGQLVWAGPRTSAAALQWLTEGLDANGRVFLYTPATFSEGSSLSHFSADSDPELLMQPFASNQVNVFENDLDLGLEFLQDLGFREPGCGNGIVDSDEECDWGDANDANADAPDECTTLCAWFVADECPEDPNKTTAGTCGCGVADSNSDADNVLDCNDGCPTDGAKVSAGWCGCGVADTDSDGDESPNCLDECAEDPNKTAAGLCGCGVADTDSDGDELVDCLDQCPADPEKAVPGGCGCDVADTDSDGDEVLNCNDACVDDPLKQEPGACGCGVLDVDADADNLWDCMDGCPLDANKVAPGACGCGTADADSDGDGAFDCAEICVTDAGKQLPGECGCGIPDVDADEDGVWDCNDACPGNAAKSQPGVCGCGASDRDTDSDGTADCNDACPANALKLEPGLCGCAKDDRDSDKDGTPDCLDDCASNPNKVSPGVCGCGAGETDRDEDGVLDCQDRCPDDTLKSAPGTCGCGRNDDDSDGDGVLDCRDGCPEDGQKLEAGQCGCGASDSDTDADGWVDCRDACPDEAATSANGCPRVVNQPEPPDAGTEDAGAAQDAGSSTTPTLPTTLPFDAGSSGEDEALERLQQLLADGGYVSPEQLQALLSDAGLEAGDLDPALLERLARDWAADGGLSLKIDASLPEVCLCRVPAAGSGKYSGSAWLVAGALVALTLRRRRKPAPIDSR